MATHFSGTLPAQTLFQYLTDDLLAEIESNDLMSTYVYACGCSVCRESTTDECYVRWCDMHRRPA